MAANVNPYNDGVAIAAVTEAHALNSTFSDTEVEAALNLLAVAINDILIELRDRGIIPS